MRLIILLRRWSADFPRSATVSMAVKWSLVCSASSSCMIEFRERVWSRPTDSWDHLIIPLPLEYDTWFREKYTARFLFIHCEHSVVIKTDSVIFWEFHPASVVFFFTVGSTPSHAWDTWRQTCRWYPGRMRSGSGTLTHSNFLQKTLCRPILI
jgi:hypothetical protein